MKKYLSIVLGIILTACLVACSNSSKDLVEEQDEEVISNQEVSDTEEQDTSAELGRQIWMPILNRKMKKGLLFIS